MVRAASLLGFHLQALRISGTLNFELPLLYLFLSNVKLFRCFLIVAVLLDPTHFLSRRQSGPGRLGTLVSANVIQEEKPREFVGGHMITLCNQGRLQEALVILNQLDGKTDRATFACVLQTCSTMKALEEGKRTHAHMCKWGLERDTFLGNLLIRMYDKCESLDDARSLFDDMHHRNVVSWNLIIGVYSNRSHRNEAFYLLGKMLQEYVKPDKITFISILNACASSSALSEGKLIHVLILENSIEVDVIVGNALINMYCKCESLDNARRMFENMLQRNVTTWNIMIAAYSQQGHGDEALKFFKHMHCQGMARSKITFINILNGYAHPAMLADGKLIHAEIAESGIELDLLVGTALIKMYGKCGSLADARWIFDTVMPKADVVLWTTMIAAYIQQGNNGGALQLFQKMQHEGVKPNKITFVTILNACISPDTIKMIHKCIRDRGMESDIFVGNALLNMYQKCGSIEDAEHIFFKMAEKDVISWTAMIAAYAQEDRGKEALHLFQEMKRIGVKPDKFTLSSVLDACGGLAALAEGRSVHFYILENGVDVDVIIGNALVSMYGKCGSPEDAYNLFLKLPKRDEVSWSAIIAACGNHGYGKEAVRLFQQMQGEGLKPSKITFISLLSACSHAGLIDEACQYFASMTQDYGITPTLEHCMCMVDLMGRAGCLTEAEAFINRLPLQPSAILWNTLLGACRTHGNMDRGQHAAERVLELDPHNEAGYVVLANIYAAAGRSEEAAMVRKAMVVSGSMNM